MAWLVVAMLALLTVPSPAWAADAAQAQGSLADTRVHWPSAAHVQRVLMLRDYNTRVVLLGTLLLGVSAGVMGTFMLLRKRALVGDAVSHASLPGIGIAFIVMEMIRPGQGRSLPALLVGAFVAGLLGAFSTMAIRKFSRIREDAALAIVLSMFFGLGIALFTVIQNIPSGNTAGLQQFIFGKAASIVADDVKLIAAAAAAVLLLCALLYKEFTLLCFDEKYAAAGGWPTTLLDLALMSLVVVVTVIGLQSVGLLLVVAMLIVPASAARFWTDRLLPMTLISATLGGASALVGVLTSALMPRLAAGAIIVLSASFFFTISMFAGARRGVVRRALNALHVRRRVGRHDLLRALYECLESPTAADGAADSQTAALTGRPVRWESLLAMRTWTPHRLHRLLAAARRQRLVERGSDGAYRLTTEGEQQARRVVRNHRLWETYLIAYADIAPSHVDRDADEIEHLIDPALHEELETLLAQRYPRQEMPPSPHAIGPTADAQSARTEAPAAP